MARGNERVEMKPKMNRERKLEMLKSDWLIDSRHNHKDEGRTCYIELVSMSCLLRWSLVPSGHMMGNYEHVRGVWKGIATSRERSINDEDEMSRNRTVTLLFWAKGRPHGW